MSIDFDAQLIYNVKQMSAAQHNYVEPRSIHDVFARIESHLTQIDILAAVFRKMAAYPVTDLNLPPHEEKWEIILKDKLNFPEILIEVNFNFLSYGNTIVTLDFPRAKKVKCGVCGYEFKLTCENFRSVYQSRPKIQAEIKCPKCQTATIAEVTEELETNKDPKLLMFDPKSIYIKFDEIARISEYYLITKQIPVNPQTEAEKKQWLGCPLIYLEAAYQGKSVKLEPESIFHMKTVTLAGKYKGWGIPILFFALRKMFHLKCLLDTEEALLKDHFYAYRYIFPQLQGGSVPLGQQNLLNFTENMKTALRQYHLDPNRVLISPIPIGTGIIGGQGKAFDLTAEIQEWTKQLIASTGVPLEFAYGGLSWSGSNVSLRMLENFILYMRKYDQKLIDWVVKRLSDIRDDLKPIPARLTEFRMADDAKKKAQYANLYGIGLLAPSTLLSEYGLDLNDELSKRIKDLAVISLAKKKELEFAQKAQAEIQAMMEAEQYEVQRLLSSMMPQTQVPQTQVSQEQMVEETAREKKQEEKGEIPTEEPPQRPPKKEE